MHAVRTVLGLSILFLCSPLMGAQDEGMSWRVEEGKGSVDLGIIAPGLLEVNTHEVPVAISFFFNGEKIGLLKAGPNANGLVSMDYGLGTLRLAKTAQEPMSLSVSGVEEQG